MLMTGLRTKWGVDLNKIKSISIDSYDGLEKGTEKWIDQGYMLRSDNQITLTAKGKMIADKIISELFEV